MAGPLLKSLASEVLKDMPATKPEAVENALLRKGVKKEELKFMNLGLSPREMQGYAKSMPQVLDSKGRVIPDVLSRLDQAREDQFSEKVFSGSAASYSGIVPVDADIRRVPGSYKERIIEFKQPDAQGEETVVGVNNHFGEDNYLMHTRSYDELITGTDTRVVTEIQSDIHQKGLAAETPYKFDVAPNDFLYDNVGKLDFAFSQGNPTMIKRELSYRMGPMFSEFSGDGKLPSDHFNAKIVDFVDNKLPKLAEELAPENPTVGDLVQLAIDNKMLDLSVPESMTQAVVKAPWQSSWMRKGLENEIMHAVQEGKAQIAIPIKSSGLTSAEQIGKTMQNLPAEKRAELQKALDYANSIDLESEDAGLLYEVMEDILGNDYSEVIDYALRSEHSYAPGNITIESLTDAIIDQPEVRRGAGPNAMSSLMRSPGVQKWYETAVEPTAAKLAKQMGAEFKVVNQDGVQYAVIDLTKGANTKNFTLYAAGAPLAAYMALQEGYSEEEVYQGMLDQGYTEAEATDALAKAPKVAEAKANDYTDEEINEFFNSQQPKPEPEFVENYDWQGNLYLPPADTGDAKSDAAYLLLNSPKQLSSKELIIALQTVYPDMSSITTRLMASLGDEDAAIKAQRTEAAVVKKIEEGFRQRGAQAEFLDGEWYVVNSQDNPDDLVRITPNMWDDFWVARGEAVGVAFGAVAGAKIGANISANAPHPYLRYAAIGVSSIAGAAAGAVVGTELDYLRDAVLLSEELSAHVSAHKALTAAELSVVGDLVGLGIFRGGGWTLKQVIKFKDFTVGGNKEGAKQALRDTMFLRESEIDEATAKLSKVIDTSAMSQAQREITATALLLPGVQDLVRAAGVIDPKASRAVVRAINDRAADVLKTTGELAGPGAPTKLYEDLNAYTQQTKEYYQAVKMAAATAPRAKYYKFNIDQTALDPVYEQLRANIQDPATLDKFILQVQKAKRHANGRTFEDLIELRQMVNDFAFNGKLNKGKAAGALRQVIDNIDERIEKGSRFVFGVDKADAWLKDFSQAKAEYAKMKSLERNSLVKLVRRPGVQPELISAALIRYANSVDGTYEHVMGAMPPSTRVTVEGDMINTLAEKYSLGLQGGPRAVHFPMLSAELNKIQLVTPEARKLKAALNELSEVFQNDVALSTATGIMTVPKFQSYLTVDPVVRAQFAVASEVFNYVKTLVPGEAGRQASLLRNTAKFLETPLNAKALKYFTAELGDSVNLSKEILAVQQAQGEAIAKNLDRGAARVKFYGDGNIVSTSGRGLEVAIPRHRIASKAVAQGIANREAVSLQDKKSLDLVLSKYGYKAIELGTDKVRILKP